MERYIKNTVKNIIYTTFKISIDFDIKKFRSFLTDERIGDIKEYKEYCLISPQLYNICYFYLTKIEKLNKKNVIDVFREDVDKNREEMKLIRTYNYTVKEYKNIVTIRKIEEEKIKKSKYIEEEKINKNTNTKEKINWDIEEYELIRGDWNSVRV